MISDSTPWREQLLRIADALQRRAAMRAWRAETAFRVERDLLIGAFAVRKLIDSAKTSTLLPDRPVVVGVHRLTGRVPRLLDRWTFWEHYDVASRQRGTVTVRQLCHAFVHSFVLDFAPSDDGPAMVWVVSERDRSRNLYSVPLADIADVFRFVGDEDVVRWHERVGQPSLRLSQHDLVEVGFAVYDPYPFATVSTHSDEDLDQAFPSKPGPPSLYLRSRVPSLPRLQRQPRS